MNVSVCHLLQWRLQPLVGLEESRLASARASSHIRERIFGLAGAAALEATDTLTLRFILAQIYWRGGATSPRLQRGWLLT